MKEIFVIFPGLQDPAKPAGHQGGPVPLDQVDSKLRRVRKVSDLRAAGLQPGPVLTALESAQDPERKQKISVDALWLLYSPDSDPVTIDRHVRLTQAAVNACFPSMEVERLPLQKTVFDSDPYSKDDEADEERERVIPINVGDYEACFSMVPEAILRKLKDEPLARLNLVMGPGTPQMNLALLELGRSWPDARVFQALHPSPNRAPNPLNRQTLRELNLDRIHAVSPLGQTVSRLEKRVEELEAELQRVQRSVQALQSPQTVPDGVLTLAAFASAPIPWQQLGVDRQRALLAEGCARSLSAPQLAVKLGISERAVRDALKRFDLKSATSARGRPPKAP